MREVVVQIVVHVVDDGEVGEGGEDAGDLEAYVRSHRLGDLRLLLQRGLVLDCAPAARDDHEEVEPAEEVEYQGEVELRLAPAVVLPEEEWVAVDDLAFAPRAPIHS